ncbi:CBS domain-containing protein [Halorubellus salinus]|uniref:CBS domain-containing protein n=1 Tax=Halorubellus salinus TaxID=755309 RepID=UPI001D0643C2|nr:CBS domain-containing protein [Halorubellus salinus]
MFVDTVMTTPVETIDADATMADALHEMLDREVGSLVVTTGTPPRKAGIVTDADVKAALHDAEHPLEDASVLDRFLFLLHRPVTGAPIREYMSSPLVTVEPDATLSEAVATMNDHEIKHLVVTKHMRLEGILTASDVARVHDDIVSEARRSETRRPHWER